MVVSKELVSYSSSYYDHLSALLHYEKKINPHFKYAELRVVAKKFRNAEQDTISKIENGPLHAGNHKVDMISRYAPFYHDAFFIKYFILPTHATTNVAVDYVLLESIVRQNSEKYNSHFIKHLPQIDVGP